MLRNAEFHTNSEILHYVQDDRYTLIVILNNAKYLKALHHD